MANERIINLLCNMMALVLSMLLVALSSLQVISYGEHLADAAIAVLTFFGIRSCGLMCVSFFRWYQGGNSGAAPDK
ncbi:hypothetical protein [Serratia entomophila]|uniref:hypothetical protein n=1 Tax=Serratia entomophila TaxID=42906 RepID=UPI00217A8356|nr:hypothetical protein [Serratia entomophila]CAI0966467.1 Uncharacterised protein [Serratia entomophila]CAI1742182.1 Uncharacterised protein [Serratia entomophila]CAI1808171.1 Uncharacterised protein [Serratia entomophila]CAI1813697.1 Uncharacterised protein [Serratia entomophila]